MKDARHQQVTALSFLLAGLLAAEATVRAAPPGSTPVPLYVTESVWRGDDALFGRIHAVRELADGNVLVVATGTMCLLASDGTLLSAVPFEVPACCPFDDPVVAIDPLGAVFVADTGKHVLHVWKLDGRTGRPLWTGRRGPSFTRGRASPAAMHLDPAGNPIVVIDLVYGLDERPVGSDVAVVAFDRETGAARFAPRILDAGEMDSHEVSAVGPRGELFLVVSSRNIPAFPFPEQFTYRFHGLSGLDGEALWNPVAFGGPSDRVDRILDLEADGAAAVLLCAGQTSSTLRELRLSRFRTGDGVEDVVRRIPSRSDLWEGGAWLFLSGGPALAVTGAGTSYEVHRIDLEGPHASVQSHAGKLAAAARLGDRICASSVTGGRLLLRSHAPDGSIAWEVDGGVGTDYLSVVERALVRLASGNLGSDDVLSVNRWAGSGQVSEARRLEGSSGEEIWRQALGGPSSSPFSRETAAIGTSLFASGIGRHSGPGLSIQTLAFDVPTGALRWQGTPFAVTNDVLKRRTVPDDQGNLARAYYDTYSADSLPYGILVDFLEGSTGERRWGPSTLRAGFQPARLTDLACDAASGVHVLGESPGGAELFTLEAGTGQVRFRRTYPGVLPTAVAATPDGRVTISGVDPVGRGWVTQLSAETGAPLWGPILLDLPDTLVFGTGYLRILAGGDLVAVWTVDPSRLRMPRRPFVARLDGSSGALAWPPLSLPDSNDSASIAVSGADQLLVCGTQRIEYVSLQIWTAKVELLTGGLLWGPVWRQEADTSAFIRDVASGPEGEALALVETALPPPALVRKVVLRWDGDTGEPLEPVLPPWEAATLLGLEDGFLLAGQARVARYAYDLGLDVVSLEPAACGRPYGQPLPVRNGTPPFSLTLAEGTLPVGLSLDAGTIAGSPSTAPGRYSFEIEVGDATGQTSRRRLHLDVVPADGLAIAGPRFACAGRAVSLEAPEGFASYSWKPGGETTRSILALPSFSTAFTVHATEAGGCVHTGSLELLVLPDGRPPDVLPPAAVSVLQSTCAVGRPGATAATSSALASFLAGGSALDDCDPAPARLPALAFGVEVTPGTFFPAGDTPVTFRFRDVTGSIGSATRVARVLALGDLDGSGAPDVFDLLILATHLAGNLASGVPPFSAPAAVGDVNGDGSTDLFDLVLLAAHLAGNVPCLPP